MIPKAPFNYANKNKTCPICHKIINNPAILTVSGNVFCLVCISEKIKKELKCPVTNVPCTMNSIRKIYKNS